MIFQMHESFKILLAILTVERGIKKLPIVFRTGYHFGRKSFLKRGLDLVAWAAHTHPKPTRVPPQACPPATDPRARTVNIEALPI